ncbi:MAG: hypothetical protein O2972_04720, partial [Cyanobacteria bacterium]|nr:hypothetical protein [Cyanobacteriota bacterium]
EDDPTSIAIMKNVSSLMVTLVVSLISAGATSAVLIKFNAMHGSTLTLCLIFIMAFLLPFLGNRHSESHDKRGRHNHSTRSTRL